MSHDDSFICPLLCVRAGVLKLAPRGTAANLRAQLLKALATIDELELPINDPPADPPPEPPPPPAPPARELAKPAERWYNTASKGRPTEAEVVAATLLIAATTPDRGELQKLFAAVDAEFENYSQQGDAWRCTPIGAWAPKCVVQDVLAAAVAAKLKPPHTLQAITHELNRQAQLDLDAADVRAYLRAIARDKLKGPACDAKGGSSARFQWALPDIVDRLRRQVSAVQKLLATAAAVPPPPTKEQLQAQVAATGVINAQLHAELATAHASKRKARSDANAAKQVAKRRKVEVRTEGQTKLQARIRASVAKAVAKAAAETQSRIEAGANSKQ